jgi:hypothetical protein
MQLGFRESPDRVVVLTPEQVNQSEFLKLNQPHTTIKAILQRFAQVKMLVDPLTVEEVDHLFFHGISNANQSLVLKEWMDAHRDEILAERVQRIGFVADETLALVVEFLQLDGPKDFSDLPSTIRGKDDQKLKTFQIAISWIAKLSIDQVQQLALAAISLGIQHLGILCASVFARFIVEHEEDMVRKQFQIPDRFRDATLTKLRQIFVERKWEQTTLEH